ncbi:MAG: GHKL domain-containing protein [Melioribacteraceae bacterium]|nr:GHKL domain-containing protein [Melioribacteraceae bacterium]MCF8353749.1 GHKL domain-containing protein [Melioribacteraceae bacterium]MCF8392442.1 GHKL domain-containing protein [Melioribacteraceae bacterium]MCF8418353.1 GHKL domain-containing protein [Melioribacteraceae bacterium]
MNNLIKNNKLQILGKLSASFAHDARNPLSALKLNLNYLKLYPDIEPDEISEGVNACLEAVERIEALIENTLDFSRRPGDDTKMLDINKIILDAAGIMTSFANRNGIKIVTDLDEIPEIDLHKNKILQVLLNLIGNAIEACSRGSEITISTRFKDQNQCVEVAIKDEGVGIKDSDKDKIFDDFFTNKDQGTGLGLSVCKMILGQQNAQIYFESTYGKGTTFFVMFYLNDKSEGNET